VPFFKRVTRAPRVVPVRSPALNGVHAFNGRKTLHLVRARRPAPGDDSDPRARARVSRTLSFVQKRKLTSSPVRSHSTTSVPYETEADAEAVRATLSVDNELQPDKVVKKLKVEGTTLVAYVASSHPACFPPSRDRAIFVPAGRPFTISPSRLLVSRDAPLSTPQRLLRHRAAAPPRRGRRVPRPAEPQHADHRAVRPRPRAGGVVEPSVSTALRW